LADNGISGIGERLPDGFSSKRALIEYGGKFHCGNIINRQPAPTDKNLLFCGGSKNSSYSIILPHGILIDLLVAVNDL